MTAFRFCFKPSIWSLPICVRVTAVKVAENLTNYWLRITASTQHLLDRGGMHLLVTDFLTGKLLKRDAIPSLSLRQLSI
jgi:hypothetical protein